MGTTRIIVEIVPSAREQYRKWICRLHKELQPPENRQELADAYLRAILRILESGKWREIANPRGDGLFAIPIHKQIVLMISVSEPVWWQFWKPIRITGLRFQTFPN
jgi:hypothetical protein